MDANLKYDESLLRDENYGKLFAAKLNEIKAVIKTNDFLTFKKSYGLINELKEIYSKNIEDYLKFYKSNSDDVKNIIDSINSNGTKILPFRKKEILQLTEKAKAKLVTHNYGQNEKARKIISLCKKRLERLVLEYNMASSDHKKFTNTIENYYNRVWNEDMGKVDKIKKRCSDIMFDSNYDFKAKEFITLNTECVSEIDVLISNKSTIINNDIAFINKNFNDTNENDIAKEQIKELESYLTKRITKADYQLKYEAAIKKIKSTGITNKLMGIGFGILFFGAGITVGYFVFMFLYKIHYLLGYAFLLIYGGAVVVVFFETLLEWLMDRFIKE